jgi:hypothetical protein
MTAAKAYSAAVNMAATTAIAIAGHTRDTDRGFLP